MLFVKRDSANCVIFILSLEKRKNCSAILVSANLGHFVYIYMVFMCFFFRSKMEPQNLMLWKFRRERCDLLISGGGGGGGGGGRGVVVVVVVVSNILYFQFFSWGRLPLEENIFQLAQPPTRLTRY